MILIIGGGIGGLTLAQKLKQAGVRAQVFERNAEAGDWLQGFRIQINEHGSHALRQCLPPALWEAFTKTAGRPGQGMAFQTEQLDEMLFVEEELMTDPEDRSYAVSRITLRRLLLAGLDVHFGRTFERYEINGDQVTAHFTDGSSATGDVLIGADGANSVVRGQLLLHAQRVLTDIIGVAGRVPLNDETRKWLPHRVRSGMNIVLPRSPAFLFSAVFDGRRRTTDALDQGLDLTQYGLTPEDLLDDLEDYVLWAYGTRALPEGGIEQAVRKWHPDLRRMVAESDPGTITTMPFKTSTPVRPWQTTRVTLLGDAIHNMTPVMGLGANTALRDAAL
ncbi:MAG TPA: NAD(P)/FAD-dependent oxidoreductase, partial [Lentzea sp.]